MHAAASHWSRYAPFITTGTCIQGASLPCSSSSSIPDTDQLPGGSDPHDPYGRCGSQAHAKVMGRVICSAAPAPGQSLAQVRPWSLPAGVFLTGCSLQMNSIALAKLMRAGRLPVSGSRWVGHSRVKHPDAWVTIITTCSRQDSFASAYIQYACQHL